MKFRPQMQLRFRGEEQFNQVKAISLKLGVSTNEWLLQQIEKANPGLVGEVAKAPEPKKVKAKAKPKTAVEGDVCPACESKNVKAWGNGKRCGDCNRNF